MWVAKARSDPKALKAGAVRCRLLLRSTAMQSSPWLARHAQIGAWCFAFDPWWGAVIALTLGHGTRAPVHPAPAESLQMTAPRSSVYESPHNHVTRARRF